MPHNQGYPPVPGASNAAAVAPGGTTPATPALPVASPAPTALPPTPGPGATQGNLSPEEMAELDSLVTPRLAFLISKAYPPAFEVLRQFFGDDLMETQGRPRPVAPAAVPGGPAVPTSGLSGTGPVPQGR